MRTSACALLVVAACSSVVEQVTMPNGTSSIHGDARGELYLTTIGGRIYHLEATP